MGSLASTRDLVGSKAPLISSVACSMLRSISMVNRGVSGIVRRK